MHLIKTCTSLCLSVAVCFGAAVTVWSQSGFEGWRRIGSTDKDEVYFQLKSVRITDSKTVKAWIRYQYKRAQYEQLSEYRIANGTVEGFDDYKYEYILELQEFNCRERRSRTFSHIRYDVGGKYLSGTQYENGRWLDAVPGSIGESALDDVCMYPYEVFFDDIPPARPKAKTPRRSIKRKKT